MSSTAETFKLNNGQTVAGELLVTSANDQGIQIKVEEGKYERVSWSSFSQEDLKKFVQVKKLEPFVEPFIEISREEKIRKTEVSIKEPARLPRLERQSLIGAFSSSGLGLFILLLLYGANVYAAYEISFFRARPAAVVCGVSAVLPVIGPIIFLSMPTRLGAAAEVVEPAPEAGPAPDGAAPAAPSAQAAQAVNPMLAEGIAHPAGLKLAHSDSDFEPEAKPEVAVFPRGQYTFNRRFIETRFAGFFGVVHRESERNMVLVIKSSRGVYTGHRISRIAANEMHLQIQHGHASEEVLIPFQEIQEIRLEPRKV
jgi:hypothetical protein